jgi:PAS domain S-box-containing protein
MDPTKTSAGLRILLVEDAEHDRLAFRQAFKKRQVSCQITEYERAEEAMERLRADASSFDLVVIDHALPGISGLDLCKELLDEEVPLPVVILTGRGSEDLAVEALKAGVDDYIIKEPSVGYLDLLPLVLPEAVRKYGDRLARKQAEEALRESEKRFQQVAENAEEWIWEVDGNGLYTYASTVVERILGYKPIEIAGKKHFYDLFHPDDREQLKKAAFEVFAKHEPFREFINRNIHKNGNAVWLSTSGVPVVDIEGSLVGYRGADTNITERKRAEEALRESEEKYSTLVENSLTGIFIHQDRKYMFVNDRFADIHGYQPEELLGQDPLTLIHPDEREASRQVMSKRLEGESAPDRYEIRRLRKDGKTIWCEMMATGIEYAGRPAIMGNIVDITDRKRAEEAMRESEKHYRETVDAMKDWILVVDPDLRIVLFNEAFMQANKELGLTEDVIGRTPLEIFPFLPDSLLDEYRWVFENKEVLITHETTKVAGREFITESRKIPLLEDGRIVRVVSVIRDITEQKRLEAQLQQAQRMEAIGTLAGGIAHDFNNVLMGIQGHASLVSLETDPDHPHFEHLKGIEETVQRGADLTRQLLGFARGGKYEVKPTDLNELIEKTSEMFGRTKKEIKIHTKHQKEIWPVEVDQAQIQQVLLNLHVNAWQAMPHGGDLYIETSNVEFYENYTKPFGVEPGNYVKISVTDTGIGMDKATQQRIFDPFFTTREMGRGTGLGLSSAYGIIKNHDGIINVYSEKGKGATFNIYLPASKKELPIREKRLPDEILKGTETVLLVDDEDMVLGVGEEMLKKMGYRVLLATSGKEAVELYKRHKNEIDLVILDMIMPDMGGGEAYDRMKGDNPKVKVILSSGYSIEGQANEILERGCNGFIQKPFNIQELSGKIRGILEKG